jgi:hypothetical protein
MNVEIGNECRTVSFLGIHKSDLVFSVGYLYPTTHTAPDAAFLLNQANLGKYDVK